MEERVSELISLGMRYGVQVIGAVVILILGWIVARIVRGAVRRGLTKAQVDSSLVNFTSKFAYALVWVFVLIAALAKFGIETASFVGILAATGFAIGLALQGSLSNFASGIMILLFRPFKVGDYVDGAGVAGSVKEVQLFNTILATPDNVKIIVPNSKMYGDTIKNYSAYDTRRCDLLIGIGYASSIGKAIEVLEGLIADDARVLKEPAHQIAVSELADSSVNLVVRMWCNGPDYWGLKFDMTHKIKEAFDQNGIEIPFPQRVVHLMKDAS
ncbi:MAG: small-conductance mechanosensitive channel MscS [Candidatus Zixiibacteriota bacterium]